MMFWLAWRNLQRKGKLLRFEILECASRIHHRNELRISSSSSSSLQQFLSSRDASTPNEIAGAISFSAQHDIDEFRLVICSLRAFLGRRERLGGLRRVWGYGRGWRRVRSLADLNPFV